MLSGRRFGSGLGGAPESGFSQINLDLGGLEGRSFEMRFRYSHDDLRAGSLVTGAGASEGWFLDDIVGEGLESVVVVAESAFTAASFTLDGIAGQLTPFLNFEEELEDRFLIEVMGFYDGESTGYGKPFVLRVRSSYEDFLADYFTEAQQADALVSGAAADPEGDGLTNFMEHAFGTDPLASTVWPVSISMTSGQSPTPLFQFSQNPLASARFVLEMSGDLEGFSEISSSSSSVSAGVLLEAALQPDPALDPLPAKAFFRLRVQP